MAWKTALWNPATGDRIEGRLINLRHTDDLFFALIKSGNWFFILPDEARMAFKINPVAPGQEFEIVKTPSGFYITVIFENSYPDDPFKTAGDSSFAAK